MQKSFFLRKKGLSAGFIELKCMWLQAGLADLKNHQTSEILLRGDILWCTVRVKSPVPV